MNGVTRFMLTMGLTNGLSSGIHIASSTSSSINFNSIKSGSSILLQDSDFSTSPVRYSLSEDETYKFVKKDSTSHSHKKKCFKYLGKVGGEWPTPQRGHWFPTVEDVNSFRSKITNLCPFTDKSKVYTYTHTYTYTYTFK